MSGNSRISTLERIASALERAVAIMVEVRAEDTMRSAPAAAPNSESTPATVEQVHAIMHGGGTCPYCGFKQGT